MILRPPVDVPQPMVIYPYPPAEPLGFHAGGLTAMNRYVRQGLLADLAQGKSVLVVSAAGHRSKEVAFADLAEHVAGTPHVSVRRAHGQEQIAHPSGGRIYFVTMQSLRGREADVVYLQDTDRDVHDVLLALKPGGELIRP